ncbi:MAG TPA: aryl-sulfate sulfotransferase [bacterium]|nr:aryl-sulfate sulfotransferase [bacterium]
MSRYLCAALLPLVLFLCACDDKKAAPADDLPVTDTVTDDDAILSDDDAVIDPIAALFGAPVLNPSGSAPLTAEIPFTPDAKGALTIAIACSDIDDEASTSERFSFTTGTTIALPLLGLYPDCANTVTITLFDEADKRRGAHTVTIATAPLPDDFPIVTATGTYAGNAFTYISYYRSRIETDSDVDVPEGVEVIGDIIPEITGIMFDKNGHVRWYSDFAYKFLSPMEVIDGYIYSSDWGAPAGLLWWHDLMGRQAGTLDIGELGFSWIHHDVVKKPNGNLLLTADPVGSDYVEDHLIEIDPKDATLVQKWDLRTVMPDVTDLYRDVPMTSTDIPGTTNDPIHLNAILYDPSDGGLIVSSQRSGVAKLDADGTIRWLLAPHLTRYIDDADGDGVSDSMVDGYDPNNQLTWIGDYTGDAYTDERMPIAGKPATGYPFEFTYGELLLTPLDTAGDPITDHDTLFGFTDSEEFRWPFRPHAPYLSADGSLMLFDNGLARGFGIIGKNTFSRAVVYRITPDNDGYGGAVEQTAEYLLKHDPTWYRFSAAVGDVDDLGDGTLLVTSGALGSGFYPDIIMSQYGDGPRGAYVAQIDTATGEELHSLLIERVITTEHPNPPFSVYRAERIDPYAALALPTGLTLVRDTP